MTTYRLTGWGAIQAHEARPSRAKLNFINYGTGETIENVAPDVAAAWRSGWPGECPGDIYTDVTVPPLNRYSLEGLLRKLRDADESGFDMSNYFAVTFNLITGRMDLISTTDPAFLDSLVLVITKDPVRWARNLFSVLDGGIYPTLAHDLSEAWIMEFAIGIELDGETIPPVRK